MINTLVVFSILFPIIIGILLLIIKNKSINTILIGFSSIILILLSIVFLKQGSFISNIKFIGSFKISTIIGLADIILLIIILTITIIHKRFLSSLLAVLQLVPLIYFEFITKPHIEDSISYVSFINDNLSTIMIILILAIGSLIAFFAINYMDEFEEHMHVTKSRQPFFFFVIFLFIGAMVGIVLSNNLLNMYFFWEVTTLCSFLLIGFKATDKAKSNAFRALWMNLFGGVAFIFAIIIFYDKIHTFEISKILALKNSNEILLPLALLCVAAFTKAAQFPFQSWLLGAMVAPTPVSALFHSSTMVKAGVYLLIRFSPLFMNTQIGYMISIIGGFTFFGAALLAITQSNAKKVLAYSTVSNLGLIVSTAGIATPLAISSAILLIIFHGVSKALLFLSVGTIEHAIGSREIEDMDGLIGKMPVIGFMISLGMFSMLLPPFGVIITKLIGIEAAANYPLILIFMVLGSTLTAVYWARWMGKILSLSNEETKSVEKYSIFNILPLSVLTMAIIGISLNIVNIYNYFVLPHIKTNWNMIPPISLNSMSLIPIFLIILIIFMLIPVALSKKNKYIVKSPYLCGENQSDGVSFISAADKAQDVSVENYYLKKIIHEDKLTRIFNIITICLIVYLFGVII